MKKKEKTLKNGNDFAKKKQKKFQVTQQKTLSVDFSRWLKKVISNHNYNFQNNLSLASEMYTSNWNKKWE